MSGICGIYEIKNTKNGNSYVGQSVDIIKRFAAHKHAFRNGRHFNPHFQNAWNKYGESSFVFKILLICDKENLTYYEQLLVDKLNPLYNICRECVGSPLGTKHTEQTRLKMSVMRIGNKNTLGHKLSDEHKKKISESLTGEKNGFFGRKHSAESIKRMSEIKTGEKHNFFGKHHSEETKSKIRESNTGKTVSKETREKISKANIGKVIPIETRKKISKSVRGLKRSQETKNKISEAKKNYWEKWRKDNDNN